MTRFGIEEEFMLLDEDSLVPVPLGSAARAALPSGSGKVTTEFLTSQIEFATSPAATLADAERELRAFREGLHAFALRHAAVAISTGTPFGIGPEASVSASERYGLIAHRLGHIVDGHHVNGLHLHVQVADEEARVRAMNAVRPWMPTLLALSANSPFADGQDTGYQSWRSIIMRRFPLAGCPPHFHDFDDYRSTVDRLVRQGVISDIASVSWAARLSENYPTVEIRVFDAQLTVADTLLLAAVGRALAVSAPDDPRARDGDRRAQDTDAIHASLWAASRDGLDATLIDPETDALASARAVVALLLRTITPALDESGDLAFVQEHLERIVRSGNGAQRQRTAYAENGIAGLRSLGCAVALPGETEAGETKPSETMTGMPGTGMPGTVLPPERNAQATA